MNREKEQPLSVPLGCAAWAWLRRESDRRSRASGVTVSPSAIVRALIEREAGMDIREESIAEFRKRWKIADLGLTLEFFDHLRDRSPG